MRASNNLLTIIAGVIVVFAVTFFAGDVLRHVLPDGNSTPAEQPEPAQPPPPPLEVDARRMAADYFENEVRADGLYRGRELAITGKVVDVYWDPNNGQPVVELDGGRFDDLRARFDVEVPTLRTLRHGQRITVRCFADQDHGVPVPRLQACQFER